MNFKKVSVKFLSVVMTLALMLGVCAPFASALAFDNVEKNELSYVALGASNTNGFGLMGYLPDELYNNPVNKMQGSVYGYKMEPEDAYPALVAKALAEMTGKKVELEQLAISSMRAEELHVLLDNDYYGDKYTEWRFTAGHNWFNMAHKDGLDGLRKEYQDFVANADVITVDIGSNNFGVYASNRIFNNMFDADFTRFDEGTQRDIAKAKAEIEKLLNEYVADALTPELSAMVDHIVDAMTYALVGFCVNFDASMERIYELNPDATVVVVNIQNLMHGLYATLPGMDEPFAFGEFYGAIVDMANVYAASLSPYADKYYYAYIGEDGQAETFLKDIQEYTGNPEDLRTAVTDCFDVYDNDMYIKTRVLNELTKLIYNSNPAYVTIKDEFAGKYTVADLMDLSKFGTAVYDNAIVLAGIPIQDFLAYGEAGLLPDTHAPYYAKYEAALLGVYDTAATFMQLGANSKVMDLAAAAANFATAGKTVLQQFFAMLLYSMEHPEVEIEKTPEFQALANDPTAMAIITLGVRSDLGNSFFSHPNENGHEEIKNAIIDALENETSGKMLVLREVVALLLEYYDEAYEYAYGEAVKAGMIEKINAYLDEAQKTIDEADAWVLANGEYVRSEEFAEAYAKASADARATIEALRALINNADKLDAESARYALELLAALNTNVNDIAELLEAAATDALEYLNEQLKYAVGEAKKAILAEIARIEAEINALAEKLEAAVNEAIEQAKAEIRAMIESACEYIRTTLEEAYNRLVAYVADYVDSIVAGAGAWIEENFTNNPEELIAFIIECGEMLLDKYEDAFKGEYVTDNESSLLVIGDNAGYAQLLAEKLGFGEGRFEVAEWNLIDPAKVAKADLITIGYDENRINGFAVEQMIGYVAEYINVDLRESANEFAKQAFVQFLTALDLFEDNEIVEMAAMVNAVINGAVDGIMANELLAGKTAEELDWAAMVGEENVKYADRAREIIKTEIVKAGVEEVYTYEIDIVELLYANLDTLGSDFAFIKNLDPAAVRRNFGEYATYTVEIPVVDALTFSAESYLYGMVEFNTEYAQTVLAINAINPEAQIVLLSNYNPIDGMTLTLGETTVDMGEIYGAISAATSVHSFVYALTMDNVTYVDISEVETVFDAYVEAGLASYDIVDYLMAYVTDASITDASEAGAVYICEQIMSALTVRCGHAYDNDCDAECNYCGELREVAEHSDENKDHKCDVCGEALTECADGNKDHNCDLCGETLSKCLDDNNDHVCDYCNKTFTYCIDVDGDHKCDTCGETLSTCGDTNKDHNCDVCGEALSECADTNKDHTCDYCGKEGVTAHEWTEMSCDKPKTCKICGITKGGTMEHDYAEATCDAPMTCKVCGSMKGQALGHSWTDATCAAPKHCERCEATEGEALAHTWTEATCTAPKTCTVCQATEGEALAHTWTEATCTAPKTCTVCQATEGEALAHSFNDATCDAPKTCKDCGATEGSALGHKFADATCTAPKTCTVCQATEGDVLAHTWTDATCTAPKTCTVCKVTEGDALAHDFKDADCETAKTCKNCGATEGEALGHKYDSACDGDCNTCGATRTPAAHAYGDWVVTKEATETEDGEKQRTCSCGEVEKEVIPATGKGATDNKLSGGALAAIIGGSVILLAAAAVLVVRIVLKKKKI